MLAALLDGARGFRGRIALAVLLLVAAKLAAVAVPLLLKRIVDVMSQPESLALLPAGLLAGYAFVRFSATLFGELRDLAFARVTQTTVAGFATRIFRHLHALSFRFHSNRATGALARDFERGTAAIGYLIRTAFLTLAPTVVEIAAVLLILTLNYPAAFSLVIAGTFIAYAFYTVYFIARRTIRQRRVNELDSRAQRRLVDSLLNYEAVKVYANEAVETGRFQNIMRDWIEAGIHNQGTLTVLHIGQSAIIGGGVAAVMLLAGRDVMAGMLTVGDLVLVNAYVIQVCLPLNALGFVVREANDAFVNAERIFALLREPPEAESGDKADVGPPERAEVCFERVSFGYEPGRQVVEDIEFTIPAGSTVAVVGGSGSGKSTLGRLLLRFADPWQGRICINGEDIRRLCLQTLRATVGVVPQDTCLFDESIAYNIAYGRPGAGDEEIRAAAEAADLGSFVGALPGQYATVVGERGLKLSGGEKQRIAIARAILRDAPVLILDEATSALDVRTERAIQNALDRLARTRTTLVIAHRLSTVMEADEILVLERGRIIERGRHADLLARSGLYAQMWALQKQERELRRSERRAGLRPINLAEVVRDAIDLVRADIDGKGIQPYAVLDSDVGTVTGDSWTLREVVSRLLAHAVEVSDPGDRLQIELRRAANEVRLQITDMREQTVEGRARPAAGPADLDRLRILIGEHHGRLTMEPASPAGMTYSILLPVRAVSEGGGRVLHHPQPGPAASAPWLAGRCILVVDDDEDAREVLRLILGEHGADVVTRDSSIAALAWLRDRPSTAWPDLIVCDIGLPGDDGYSLLRNVRALEAGNEVLLADRAPAIALTGYAQPEDRLQALVAGFQLHLSKPVDPDALLATVAFLMGIRAPHEP